MRILHISETDYEGGAGKAAYSLHRGLRKSGVESFFLGECVQSCEEDVYSISGLRGVPAKVLRRCRTLVDQSPLRQYPSRTVEVWSVGWLPRRFPKLIEKIRPDIVHLHWISEMLPAQMIGRFDVPIVWTHHDWGVFTGGCRCPVACSRFETGCGSCPLLRRDNPHDLSWQICQRKRVAWNKSEIHSVAVGTGLANDIRRSWVLGDKPCTMIPNGIDTDCFHPLDRQRLRHEMGLTPDAFVILFGAFSLNTPLKGGQLLMEAIARWKPSHPEMQVCLLTVGSGHVTAPSLTGVAIRPLGFLDNPTTMARAYNAADVVVVPSRIESFGLMAAEAQACGVPVVAFAETGARDIVIHRETGFLTKSWDAETFAEGLDWAATLSPAARCRIAVKSAENVRVKSSLQTVADAHQALYRMLLQDTKANGRQTK